MQLDRTPVLITGGGSGLGAATARAFAAEGAAVAVLDIDEDAARSVAAEIEGVAVACDVADPDSVEVAMGHVAEAIGVVRVAVCCAGIGAAKRMVGRKGMHSMRAFDTVMKVNLYGTFDIVRHVVDGIVAADADQPAAASAPGTEAGVVITTSSIAAYDGVDAGVAYAASKAAVAGMTLALARDLAKHRIRAMSIAPGSFATPLVGGMHPDFADALSASTPFPARFGAPDEFATLARHIAENPMLNGEVIRLDGGLRMQPSPGWKR